MSGQGSFVPTEDFYPRPPRGGRRLLICAADLGGHISIHALREEGDALLAWSHAKVRHFYPRPPRGGRPQTTSSSAPMLTFLSTPSARRAT